MERLTNSDKEIPDFKDNAEYWLLVYFKLKDLEDLADQGTLLQLPVKKGDIVWELCECDDGIFRIFPMEVKVVAAFGELLRTSSRCCVWNIYAESDYTKMYKSFYDIGTSVFLTEEAAKAKLAEIEESHER